MAVLLFVRANLQTYIDLQHKRPRKNLVGWAIYEIAHPAIDFYLLFG